MLIAVVDDKHDEDPGKYERLVKERDQAEAQLRAELQLHAQKWGVPLEQLAEAVKLKELAPQEFSRLHKEASRIAAEEEANLLRLKSAAKELKSAIADGAKTEDPFKLHAARVQLQELNAQIKKWK